jgi:O-succinylbenzoate synthase
VRNARADAPATRFLGVRLTSEEESLLDGFQRDHGISTRSDAVRALVRSASEPQAGSVSVPPTLMGELEELVENGYARDLEGAIALVTSLGLTELARTHSERLPALRERARSVKDRREGRRRADREGRGLLGR